MLSKYVCVSEISHISKISLFLSAKTRYLLRARLHKRMIFFPPFKNQPEINDFYINFIFLFSPEEEGGNEKSIIRNS